MCGTLCATAVVVSGQLRQALKFPNGEHMFSAFHQEDRAGGSWNGGPLLWLGGNQQLDAANCEVPRGISHSQDPVLPSE